MTFLRLRWIPRKILLRQLSANIVRQSRHVDEIPQKLKAAGYRGESHKVETEDGYVLNLHRVLPQKHSQLRGSAFLMHGLFRNSSDFLATGPNIALAYYLADHGFDVWLGNARGTKYSREHVHHPYDSKEFWKFSFHEIGLFDVSAMVNFMLSHTKEESSFYVGHSQGAGSLLALLSSQPEFNKKIKQAHLMTPGVFLKNSTSPMLTLPAKSAKLIMSLADKVGKFDASAVLRASQKLCNINEFNHETALALYKNITCAMVGKNKKETQIAQEALQNFHENMSPAVSMRQLLHFLQLHLSGKFRQYDHGPNNFLHYKSENPPDYELGNVTAPVYLYATSEDSLTSHKDVAYLSTLLPNVVDFQILDDWNHMDVMLGKNSRTLLYANILTAMNARGPVDNKVCKRLSQV